MALCTNLKLLYIRSPYDLVNNTANSAKVIIIPELKRKDTNSSNGVRIDRKQLEKAQLRNNDSGRASLETEIEARLLHLFRQAPPILLAPFQTG